MSCGQWDDMLAICIELAEYDHEEAVIRKIRETISKTPTDPKDLALVIPEPTKLPIKIKEPVGYH